MKYLRTKYNEFKISIICKKLGIKNWSIRDGLVDVGIGVDIYEEFTKLPLKFGRVSGSFYFYTNRLITLEGSPEEVDGHFNCGGNKLTTLEGSPSEVGGDFYCNNNRLTTLEHFPRVGGYIYLSGNPLPKEIKDNKEYLRKIIEWQDEYDIWRDGELYLPRFRDLMIDIKEGL